MKKKKLFIIVLTAVAFWAISLVVPVHAYASENGGAVQTNGVISFYDEDSATSPSSSQQKENPQLVEKPKGRYPSTGELVKKSLSLSGFILLLAAIILFFWTRKKSKKGDVGQ
ncbi:LPXTG cell wall anchor domain-containing protein [Enterococcus quebecensis]|uniref:Gram-positive cocci surface proteins LPxTG domain-containing protein n=1 Tax=Enterococcus quebecensis TaxID=903983 RepID=A0A1E5GS53_9ENTE|nr:LPXTG cell wall anchor domain-containing protein [Enterococcus quebecensis]OEG15554.1 hypothetical protein BCR23_08805 [Enterococcus quebecensis]OJG74662.1 LPXTG-domain-containing protein cell wall anchor domain [Enterococcus quebecensis]